MDTNTSIALETARVGGRFRFVHGLAMSSSTISAPTERGGYSGKRVIRLL